MNSRILRTLSALGFLGVITLTGCAELLNDPNGYGGGYGGGYGAPPPYYGGQQPYYGGGYYDNGYYGRERRELERERERLEDERERLERERQRERQPQYSPPPPPRPAPERCPPGFSPSEQKCSREERRRGCRDMRLPGGLGCVDRR